MSKTEELTKKSTSALCKKISVCIVNWNTEELLRACLRSLTEIQKKTGFSLEIIVVDNASADDSAPMVAREFPHVLLIENTENMGYARGNNQALDHSTGDYILFLNPDTEIPSNIFEPLVKKIESDPALGVVTCQLRNFDGSIQHFCSGLPTLYDEIFLQTGLDLEYPDNPRAGHRTMSYFDHNCEWYVEQPPGTFLFVRRSVVNTVGGLDEQFPIFFNDVDWCKRVHDAGWKILFTPEVFIYHHKSASIKKNLEKHITDAFFMRRLYYQKHFHSVWTALLSFFAPFGFKKNNRHTTAQPPPFKKALVIRSSFDSHFMTFVSQLEKRNSGESIDLLTPKSQDLESPVFQKKFNRTYLYSGKRKRVHYFQTNRVVLKTLKKQNYDAILFPHATVDGAGYWNIIFFCALLFPKHIGAYSINGIWHQIRPWGFSVLRGLLSYCTAYLLLIVGSYSRIHKLRR